jgi:hypothetical protein
MDAWARGVAPRLQDQEIEVAAASGEQGARAVVRLQLRGVRDDDGARLVLAVSASGVQAGLELPASQARAARVRLSDPARALELSTAFEALPEQFTMGAASDGAAAEAPRATADDVRALLDRVEREHDTVWIGWTVPREVALEHAALLDEQLADAIVALAQVFSLLVASPRDPAGAQSAGEVGERDRRFSGRRPKAGEGGDESGPHPHHPAPDDERHGRGRVGRARARGRDREHDVEGEGEVEPEPIREVPVLRGRPFETKLPARPGRRPSKGFRQAPIAKGSRVRVLKGPFSGKVGVVQDLDGKGGARVMLGLLAVRIEVLNLVPDAEGHGRPRLSSSHRKPIPARS